jgi:hypothetical protein
MRTHKRPLEFFIREKSLEPKQSGWRTICEVQRQLLKLVDDELAGKDAELAAKFTTLIEESYDLGKRMDRRLRQSNNRYISEMYEVIEPNADK